MSFTSFDTHSIGHTAENTDAQKTLIAEARRKAQEIHTLLQPIFNTLREQGLEITTNIDDPDLFEHLQDNDPYTYKPSRFEIAFHLALLVPHLAVQLLRDIVIDGGEKMGRAFVEIFDALEKRKKSEPKEEKLEPFGTTRSFTVEKGRDKFSPLAAEYTGKHHLNSAFFGGAVSLVIYAERSVVKEKKETYHTLIHLVPGNRKGQPWALLVEHVPSPGPYSTMIMSPTGLWDTYDSSETALAGVKQYLSEFLQKANAHAARPKTE